MIAKEFDEAYELTKKLVSDLKKGLITAKDFIEKDRRPLAVCMKSFYEAIQTIKNPSLNQIENILVENKFFKVRECVQSRIINTHSPYYNKDDPPKYSFQPCEYSERTDEIELHNFQFGQDFSPGLYKFEYMNQPK